MEATQLPESPQRYRGKPRDKKWGKYDYPVTPSQKRVLEAIWYMLSGQPKAYLNDSLPQNCFYSQRTDDGTVIIGLNQESINVYRSGHIASNEKT